LSGARMSPTVLYRAQRILGKGSYGVVYEATVANTTRSVAIKAVRHQMGERNFEEFALRRLRGAPNIVTLLGTFSTGFHENHRLHLVMEFIPDNLQRIIKHHRHDGKLMDLQYVSLYTYQLMRGLANLDRLAIVHRDLKPANLLVVSETHTLKMCDFGTSKALDIGYADNQPYICSRYYRAPELILSAPEYGTAVDLWSAGCVLAEMLIGQPLFAGRDGVDQLAQIVGIRGTPTADEFRAMHAGYDASVGFPGVVPPLPWHRALGRDVGPGLVELLGLLLQYDPRRRPHPLTCMAAPVFDRLRQAAAQFDPALFDFLPEELAACTQPAVRDRLAAAAAAAKQLQDAAASGGLAWAAYS